VQISNWRAVALLICSLFFGSAWAQQDNPQTCGGTQSIYFGNGVGVTTERDAVESFQDVMPSLRGILSGPARNTRYSLAYNRSVGRIDGDVLEAARQIQRCLWGTCFV
jgi:hypothetical protein